MRGMGFGRLLRLFVSPPRSQRRQVRRQVRRTTMRVARPRTTPPRRAR